MSQKPLKIICVDIEGGHGGSSRSLMCALLNMSPDQVELQVWHRRAGAFVQRYTDQDINCVFEPDLPSVSSLPRLSRNIWVYGRAFFLWWRSRKALARLERLARDADLIHFNHEALFLGAMWLRRKLDIPFTMHIRTNLVSSWFARLQVAGIVRSTDARVFITENEQRTFNNMGGHGPGTVVFNPISMMPGTSCSNSGSPSQLRVACLSNYSYPRGIDRLIDIAAEIPTSLRGNMKFVVAGDMRVSASESKMLVGTSGKIKWLFEYAEQRGVSESFHFLGHVDNPETVLETCDVLAKPTREYNPWGRDILEAMGAGLPVMSVGTYEKFVQSDETGLLQPEFDARSAAEWLVQLSENRSHLEKLGKSARARVHQLCDAEQSAESLLGFWRNIVEDSTECPRAGP